MPHKTMTYSGWGRALTATGEIARPERLSHLARLMTDAPAPALGQRRSYGDACLNDGGLAIDMTRMDRIRAFDAETGLLTVEGGAMIGDLARALAPRGWLPPVMPGTGFATVGGAVANDVHGKNHHGAGTFGQHVSAIGLLTPNGPKRITSKNKSLFAATIGGLGQTGIIETVEVQLAKAKGDLVTVTERRISDWDEHIGLLDGSEATYSVGWIDATAWGPSLGRGILEEAETGAGLVPPAKKARKVPFNAPGFALSGLVVRTFNAAYWRRVPVRGRTVVKRIEDFFFPLDKIHDWNRLYGKKGFHQFQCVVPVAEVDALRDMLETIARSGLASPLAVLKRTGPGRGGMMSFPMEGYTLAVDVHNKPQGVKLVKRLNAAAAKAGGRIYFAKDSLAEPGDMDAMYPERGKWAGIVNKTDPDRLFETDLVKRLKLRDAA